MQASRVLGAAAARRPRDGRRPEGRADLQRVGGNDGRLRERPGHASRAGVSAQAGLPGRRVRDCGPTPLRDRRSSLQGGARPDPRRPRAAARHPQEESAQCREIQAARGAGRGDQAGTRRRRPGDTGERGSGEGSRGGRRERAPQRGMDEGLLADRGDRRHCAGPGRDLVTPSTVLTNVSQVDPMKVTFPITEREYLRYADRIREHQERGRAKDEPELQLILVDGSTYPHPGRFYVANRQGDQHTGTILVQALFPNPDTVLRPGLYAKVRAPTETRLGAVVIPQRAVQEIQGVYQVAVV